MAPVTSTVRDIPSEVLLDRADGMPRQCAINCDHLQTVPQTRIGSLITTISLSRQREVRAAITFALALQE